MDYERVEAPEAYEFRASLEFIQETRDSPVIVGLRFEPEMVFKTLDEVPESFTYARVIWELALDYMNNAAADGEVSVVHNNPATH